MTDWWNLIIIDSVAIKDTPTRTHMHTHQQTNTHTHTQTNTNAHTHMYTTHRLTLTITITPPLKHANTHTQRDRVTIIHGETGCGKSSRLPIILLEDAEARGEPCRMMVRTVHCF